MGTEFSKWRIFSGFRSQPVTGEMSLFPLPCRLTNIAQVKRLSAVGLRLNASRMRRKEKAALMVEQDAPTKIRETRNQTFFQILTAG
jgi:hypothetical protein